MSFEGLAARLNARPWHALVLLAVGVASGAAAASYAGAALSVPQLLAYALAIVALVLAATVLDAHWAVSGAAPTAPFTRLDLVLVASTTVIALVLRILHLDQIPPVVFSDEMPNLQDAVNVLKGSVVSPFMGGGWGTMYTRIYAIAASLLLIPDHFVALRIISVIDGVLSVPLLYLFSRHLFGRPLAFFAGLLLALSSWHIVLSRWGYTLSVQGFFELIALYWFVRALRSRRLRHFAFCGLALGLGVTYTYAAGLLPIAIALFVGYRLFVDRPTRTRHFLVGFAFLALAAALVAAPRLSVIASQPANTSTLARASDVSVFSPRFAAQASQIVPRQFREILTSFNYRTDDDPRGHARDQAPLLDPVTAAAFGLGGLYAVVRIRQPAWVLLLLVFLVMLVPPSLSAGQTNWATAWRACGVIPALFALAAAPFAVVWRLAERQVVARGLVAALFIAAFGVIGGLNYHYYFDVFPTKRVFSTGHQAVYTNAARRVLAADPPTRILANYDVTDLGYVTLLPYGQRKVEQINWPDDQPLPVLLSDSTDPTLLIASAQRDYERVVAGATLVDLLAHYYPGGTREDRVDPFGQPMFSTYLLQPDQIWAAYGLVARYLGGTGSASGPFAATTTLDWQNSPTGSFPFSADLRGTLVVPADGVYDLALTGAETAPVSLNGRPFTSGYLLRGLYEVALQATLNNPGKAEFRWRRDGGQIATVPLANVLQQGVPGWGLTERYTLAGQTQERWVPVLVYGQPGRAFSAKPIERAEWLGDIQIRAAGDYRLRLQTKARAQAWVDDQPVPIGAAPLSEGIARLLPGVHRLRIAVDAPRTLDFRFFWSTPTQQLPLVGGVWSTPPR